MITRVPDGATRAESVAWDKLVFTVAIGDDNSLPMYEQAKQAFALEGCDLREVLVTAVRG